MTSLSESFKRYLQDKGKDRSGEGWNYRRNAACELERFAEWAASERGDEDPDPLDKQPREMRLESLVEIVARTELVWSRVDEVPQSTTSRPHQLYVQ